MLAFVRVQLSPHRTHGNVAQFFDPFVDGLECYWCLLVLENTSEGVEGELVTVLEVAVLFGVLLHRVVGEMDEVVADVQAVLLAGHPKIALLEEV